VSTSSEQNPEHMTSLQQVMAMQNYAAPPAFPQYPMAPPFSAAIAAAPSQVARYPLAAPSTGYPSIQRSPILMTNCRYRSTRTREICGALQAETNQAGSDAGRRGQGAGSPEDAWSRFALSVNHMQIRITHSFTQQHGCIEADSAFLVGEGWRQFVQILIRTYQFRQKRR
jgi:hypothetical protein